MKRLVAMAITASAVLVAGSAARADVTGEPRPFRNTGIVIGIAFDPAGNLIELIQPRAASGR